MDDDDVEGRGGTDKVGCSRGYQGWFHGWYQRHQHTSTNIHIHQKVLRNLYQWHRERVLTALHSLSLSSSDLLLPLFTIIIISIIIMDPWSRAAFILHLAAKSRQKHMKTWNSWQSFGVKLTEEWGEWNKFQLSLTLHYRSTTLPLLPPPLTPMYITSFVLAMLVNSI